MIDLRSKMDSETNAFVKKLIFGVFDEPISFKQ